jgi:protein-tyrosine phosphatase
MMKFFRILSWRLKNQGFKTTLRWAHNHLYRWIRGYPIRRDCEITPVLFVGGQFRKRGWKFMQEWGITGVLNMRKEFDDRKQGIAPELYLHMPVPDDGAPKLVDLRNGVAFMHKVVDSGGKVYVHCGAGVGRAATIAAAYLVSCGSSPDEAWEQIRTVRPFIKPSRAQVKQIEKYAAQLIDSKKK